MPKLRTDKGGRRYVSHEEVVGAELANPVVRDAYVQRRYVQEIARAIRSMRESAGLSQSDLAAMVGMKQPAIGRLETSQTTTPQWRTLNRIALALGRQLRLELGDVDTDRPLVRVLPASKKRQTADSERRGG